MHWENYFSGVLAAKYDSWRWRGCHACHGTFQSFLFNLHLILHVLFPGEEVPSHLQADAGHCWGIGYRGSQVRKCNVPMISLNHLLFSDSTSWARATSCWCQPWMSTTRWSKPSTTTSTPAASPSLTVWSAPQTSCLAGSRFYSQLFNVAFTFHYQVLVAGYGQVGKGCCQSLKNLG